MGSILIDIQETVMKYADIMSKIAQVEVEVVDKNLYRVAGTGIFKNQLNKDISSEGYVYKHLMTTGNTEIIYNPGREEICQKCPKKNTCDEEIEISMPIKLKEEIIGVIGLVGSTKQQKELILSNESMYLELLYQISDFISVKAAEITEMRNKSAVLDALDRVTNNIDRGIIIFGSDRHITMANDSAKRQLGGYELDDVNVKIVPTGDNINGQNEYTVDINKKQYCVIGQLYDIEKEQKKYSKLLIFDSMRDLREKYYEITNTISPMSSFSIIGSSPQTIQLKKEIEKIAKSISTVLITGKSGTGKEMVATAIWKASNRRNNRFVAINCGAIPEPLLESELFGYVKGAFSGADPNGRMGKFELANKGVIFLDEIGDMPLYLQVKLLRVLQERKITRIGSNQVIPIDVRIIAATNKNLEEMIAENKFREDLYYRLNVIPLEIKPLNERIEDIKDLVYFFSNRYARLFHKDISKISEEVIEHLCNYSWPGNVRELENTIEFMINMMESDGILDVRTLPSNIIKKYEKKDEPKVIVNNSIEIIKKIKDLEKEEIMKAIRVYGDTVEGKKKAAKKLGIGIATLYRKLGDYYQIDNN